MVVLDTLPGSALDRTSSLERTSSGGRASRCVEAFGEYATEGKLSPANFDSAFRRAGFADIRSEEVERYLSNFLQQRQGVSGTNLRLDEFTRILMAHEDKRRWLEKNKVGEEWMCGALRGVSHLLTKVTLFKGDCLWSCTSAESRMGIIMRGAAMLWGRNGDKGQVDFPICEITTNAFLGEGLMPRNTTKVVALGQIDLLYMPMTEVKLRLGDKFIDEIKAMREAKEKHVNARMITIQRVCRRAQNNSALTQLPFLPVKNSLEVQVSAGMQKLATAQVQERNALQAAKRAKSQRTGDIFDDDAPASEGTKLLQQTRLLRMERTGKIMDNITAPVLGTRLRSNRRGDKRGNSGIPPRIKNSELHVMIDTTTMTYDNLK